MPSKYKAKRHIIWQLQGKRCYHCYQQLQFLHSTIDHVIPVSKGGEKGAVVVSCKRCNWLRQAMSINDFHKSKIFLSRLSKYLCVEFKIHFQEADSIRYMIERLYIALWMAGMAHSDSIQLILQSGSDILPVIESKLIYAKMEQLHESIFRFRSQSTSKELIVCSRTVVI